MKQKYKFIEIGQISDAGHVYPEYMIVHDDLPDDTFDKLVGVSDIEGVLASKKLADKVIGSAGDKADAALIVAALNAYRGDA